MIEIIAAIIFFEARGERIESKRAVASVLWNHLKFDGLNLYHFSPFNRYRPAEIGDKEVKEIHNEIFSMIVYNKPNEAAWCECLELAESIDRGSFVATGPWTHFYNPDIAKHQDWMDQLINTQKIGKMIFGELR